MSEYFTIGYVSRVIGLKGELGIRMDVDDPQRYKGLDAILLADKQGSAAYGLEKAVVRGEELVIIIEGIHDRDKAKTFVGKTAMLPLDVLPELDDKQFYFHEIPGYKVIDAKKGFIGIAREVMERPMQPVLSVRDGRVEILIPLAAQTIVRVDRDKKELHVVAPEGLIDIYTAPSEEEE